jgi:hypothetical protein
MEGHLARIKYHKKQLFNLSRQGESYYDLMIEASFNIILQYYNGFAASNGVKVTSHKQRALIFSPNSSKRMWKIPQEVFSAYVRAKNICHNESRYNSDYPDINDWIGATAAEYTEMQECVKVVGDYFEAQFALKKKQEQERKKQSQQEVRNAVQENALRQLGITPQLPKDKTEPKAEAEEPVEEAPSADEERAE